MGELPFQFMGDPLGVASILSQVASKTTRLDWPNKIGPASRAGFNSEYVIH